MTGWMTLLVLLLAADQAQALYLDPTSGSLLFQTLIGGLLATLAVLRIYWQRVKALFRWLGRLLRPSSQPD